MNEHSGFTPGQLALAFVAGAAAGAITALLTAPKSGRENREALHRCLTAALCSLATSSTTF